MERHAPKLGCTVLVESACGSPQRILRSRFERLQGQLKAARARAEQTERDRVFLEKDIAQLEVSLRALRDAIDVPFASAAQKPASAMRPGLTGWTGVVVFCAAATSGCFSFLAIFGVWPTYLWIYALAALEPVEALLETLGRMMSR